MVKCKIVVIGATGTTGTYLVDKLVEEEYDVFAVGHKNVNRDYYQQKGIGCASVDIAKKEDFKKLPNQGIHTVVLLSGIMPARMKGYDPQKYIDVNITGTLNTLEFCIENNVKKIIFAQSHSDVAGYWDTGKYIKDDDIRLLNLKGDHAIYIISKNTAVDLITHYHMEYGIQNIIFRLPTIYCYRPLLDLYVNGELSVMAYRLLIEKAIRGEQIEIWGDPKIAKDIVYVKDFVQMIIGAINSDKANGMYNVGTGIPTTLDKQIRGIVKVFSKPESTSPIIYCPEKRSQTSYLYDISKAKKDLGYTVKYPYLEMLEDMKEEMKGHRFDHLKDSVNE